MTGHPLHLHGGGDGGHDHDHDHGDHDHGDHNDCELNSMAMFGLIPHSEESHQYFPLPS